MPELILYDYEMDENCYRIRLLLAMLGVPAKTISVDMYPGGEHAKPPMLALNPMGTMPVVVDGDLVLNGTAAILLYLARTRDPAKRWLPDDPAAFGMVAMWLSFFETALAPAAAARLQSLFSTPGDENALRAAARKAFRVMDDHMTLRNFEGKAWFVADGPTLADLALFPSFALSRDYGIDHGEYPALRRWIRRFRALEAFKTMPGIPSYH